MGDDTVSEVASLPTKAPTFMVTPDAEEEIRSGRSGRVMWADYLAETLMERKDGSRKDTSSTEGRGVWTHAIQTRTGCCQEQEETALQRFVRSRSYELASGLVVLLHTALATVSIELAARGGSSSSQHAVESVDLAICFWLLFELVVKMIVFQGTFWYGADYAWNWFDVVVVPLLLAEHYVEAFMRLGGQPATILRSLRFIRVFRLARGVHALRHTVWVHLLWSQLSFCAGYVVPAFLLALFVPYSFTLILLPLVTTYLNGDESSNLSAISRQELETHWGNWGASMVSLLSVSVGGTDWTEIGWPLRDVGTVSFMFFVIHVLLFRLMVLNMIMSGFIQSTLRGMHLDHEHKQYILMKDSDRTVKKLKAIFQQEVVTFSDFVGYIEDPRMVELLEQLKVEPEDAELLIFELSAAGEKNVDLLTFVRGCIKLNQVARRIDTIGSKMNVQIAQSHAEKTPDIVPTLSTERGAFTMASMTNKAPLMVIKISQSSVPQHLLKVMKDMHLQEKERPFFNDTVMAVWAMIVQLHGGCGFLVALQRDFISVRNRKVDFQVVDRSPHYPKGYMTERLRDVHVTSAEFLEAIQELTLHTEDDRWPRGHVAEGLPKDGFTLLDAVSGYRLKSAARMVGLPTPPFIWDNVGTRHLAALAACWAFRSGPSIVMVRSDSGKIHILTSQEAKNNIIAFQVDTHPGRWKTG